VPTGMHDSGSCLSAAPPDSHLDNPSLPALWFWPRQRRVMGMMPGDDNSHSHAGHPSEPHYEKRRKTTATTGAPSSRSVASLTPEQLARKRQNDRDAQRAIRERNRAQVQSLQNRIQELESQDPYQNLLAVKRKKDALQAENEDIRARLVSVMTTIEPILRNSRGLNGIYALSILFYLLVILELTRTTKN